MNIKQNGHLIQCVDDLSFIGGHDQRIVTMFSGGLDSSYLLYLLSKSGLSEIIALTVDVGDDVDHDNLHRIADHFGVKAMVVDARASFANEFVGEAISANAKYMGHYPISSSLSRPLMAKITVQKAAELKCGAIIHTANYSQNSLRRLNGSIRDLGYTGFYGSPYELTSLSREQKADELRRAGLGEFVKRSVSGDANLWCREFESGELDNPEDFRVDESHFRWAVGGASAPSTVAIEFESGVPVGLNGEHQDLVTLIAKLNREAGAHGIGRYAGLEHLEGQEKVLEVREAPAASVLFDAIRHLEMACLDSEFLRVKLAFEQLWVREAIEGRWFGSLRKGLSRFFDEAALDLSGTLHFDLQAGRADLRSVVASNGKYLTNRDAWEQKIAHLQSSKSLSVLSPGASTNLINA